MEHIHGTGDTAVVSWSAHYIPRGTPMRHAVDPSDDDAPIRVLIGTQEGVTLEMPVSVAGALILTSGRAVDEYNALRATADGPAEAGAGQANTGA